MMSVKMLLLITTSYIPFLSATNYEERSLLSVSSTASRAVGIIPVTETDRMTADLNELNQVIQKGEQLLASFAASKTPQPAMGPVMGIPLVYTIAESQMKTDELLMIIQQQNKMTQQLLLDQRSSCTLSQSDTTQGTAPQPQSVREMAERA